jgi:hypothetical protein
MADPRNKQIGANNWPAVPASHDKVAGIAVEINLLWFRLAFPRRTRRAYHAYPTNTKEATL